MHIGVLALQGAYEAHQKKIESLGLNITCELVKTAAGLAKINALILPGGESTAITYLLLKHQLWQPLVKVVETIPILATCAGVILLEKMGVLDIKIIRNGYGRQLKSNISNVEITFNKNGKRDKIEACFIRAPIIDKIYDPDIEIISTLFNKPILIRKNIILAATFHPELNEENSLVHKFFINLVSQNIGKNSTSRSRS